MLTGCVRCCCCQIECCISEWLDGIYKESAWKKEHYSHYYLSHLNSLRDFDTHGPVLEGRDLLRQIQNNLLKNARSVVFVYLKFFADTFSGALGTEAYTLVPQPILYHKWEGSQSTPWMPSLKTSVVYAITAVTETEGFI